MKESKKITIEFNEKEYKLLMLILEEAEESRGDMGCNDPYKSEEKLFTKKERIEISKQFYKNIDEVEDMDGFLFNSQYVEYIINTIKKQKKK
jgi:hypothetical protein